MLQIEFLSKPEAEVETSPSQTKDAPTTSIQVSEI